MEDIIIKTLENGCFDVHVGNRSTEQVSFDEMLGVVAQLTCPQNKRCLQWLKTEEQHQAFRNRNKTECVEIFQTGKEAPVAIIQPNDDSKDKTKKRCEFCGEVKPEKEFSKSYKNRCKKCVSAMTRFKRNSEKNALALKSFYETPCPEIDNIVSELKESAKNQPKNMTKDEEIAWILKTADREGRQQEINEILKGGEE